MTNIRYVLEMRMHLKMCFLKFTCIIACKASSSWTLTLNSVSSRSWCFWQLGADQLSSKSDSSARFENEVCRPDAPWFKMLMMKLRMMYCCATLTLKILLWPFGALYLPLPIHPIQSNPIQYNPIQSTFIALDCVQGAARGGARASLPFLHFGEHQWFITLDPYPNIIIPTPYPLLSICLTNPNRELSHSGKEATDPGLLQEHWLLKHLRLSLIPHSNSSQPLNNDLQFTRLLCLKLLPFFSGLLKVNQNRWQEICHFFCGLHSINRWKGRHLWKLLIERIDFVLSQIRCITTYNIPNSKHE